MSNTKRAASKKAPVKKLLKKMAPKDKPSLVTFGLRIAPEDLESIRSKADQYADGNVSAFIRYAALNFVPSDKDLI